MGSLAVGFKFRMLCFEHVCAGKAVFPIGESNLVVVGFGVLDLQTFGPGVGYDFVVAGKVILNVALCTDKRAHFLAGCIAVWIVAVFTGFVFFKRCDSDEKTWSRYAKFHGFRVVAVAA